MDQEAFGHFLEVLDVERDKLAPSKGAGKAEQDDGAIAKRPQRAALGGHADDEIGSTAFLRTGAARTTTLSRRSTGAT
jgi:hypothetical protein